MEDTFQDSLEFEPKIRKFLDEILDRGKITHHEREYMVELFLDYGELRYREGFDEGLSK